MKKVSAFLIPILLLIIFIVVMEGGYYYISGQEDKEKVSMYVETIKKDVNNNQWQSASKNRAELNSTWNKTIPKLQFHAEMDAIDRIKIGLGRLDGAIIAQDKGMALAELGEISEQFNNLTN